MNGPEELENATATLKRIDAALEEYEKGCGLPKVQIHSEAEQYLNMNHDDINRLSAEYCGEAAIVLAQYSFHLQRCYNAELARMTWAEDSIKRTITENINQVKGASFEERKMQATKQNEYAFKLDQIRTWAKCRADKLSYLASKVEFLARTFLDLQQTKRRINGTPL